MQLLPNRLYTEKLSIYCYVRSHLTIDREIFSTIDWHHTMAWLPASLLKHAGAYRHARQRCAYGSFNATKVKIRHDLKTFNSNKSFVYGQKHKVWVFVFLVRTSGTF